MARKYNFENKSLRFFVFILGDAPKMDMVKNVFLFFVDRELAYAHFKTFQGPFECKIEV